LRNAGSFPVRLFDGPVARGDVARSNLRFKELLRCVKSSPETMFARVRFKSSATFANINGKKTEK
jgi:hypothetical protein